MLLCLTLSAAALADRADMAFADEKGVKGRIVVLDAGHGGADPGAAANGVVEKIANLKIAQACLKELVQYAGVTIYMTRLSDQNPTLAARAQVAIDKKADIFLSLHNNSNPSPWPSGANVYYPNANYNPAAGLIGKNLASIIESNLTDLGLASGGIHIRNSESGAKYPDGSLADYYGVIKRCKENAIPALIVEHAFVSNPGDAAAYLSTDEQLEKLGKADAAGIVQYYGLKKELGFNTILSVSGTTMDLTWSTVNDASGYCLERSTSGTGGFVEVARISPAALTNWHDTGLRPGTEYFYRIRTYKQSADGSVEYGSYCATASAATASDTEKPYLKIDSIKSQKGSRLLIRWDTIDGMANYELYRASKPNGNYKKIASVTGLNRIQYTDKVKAGKLYYYKIRSVSKTGGSVAYSDFSDAVSARAAVTPTGISVVSEGARTLRVSWQADPNAAGYIIRRADSASGKYKKIAETTDGTVAFYDDASVKKEKTYYYKVQAHNSNNGTRGVSDQSAAAFGQTIRQKTKITAIATQADSQTVSWSAAKGAGGYVLYQSTSENGEYKKIKAFKASAPASYTVEGLVPGVSYYYKIRVKKKVNGKTGYGSYSAPCGAWTVKPAQIASVTGISAGRIRIAWNPAGGAESYAVCRAEAENGEYRQIAVVPAGQTVFDDSGLKMTGIYYYKIQAVISGYAMEGVAVQSAPMNGSPISETKLLSAVPDEKGRPVLVWEPVSDVAEYQIYRSTEENGTYELLAPPITDPLAGSRIDETAEPNQIYYYKIALVSRYAGETVLGNQSPAVRLDMSNTKK